MVRGAPLDQVPLKNSSQEREMYIANWSEAQDTGTDSSGNGFPDASSRVFITEGAVATPLDRDTTPISHYYSVDDIGAYEDDISAISDMDYEYDSIRKSYFYGQLADAVKRSIWWSVTSILVRHLTQSYHAIPATRIAFNVSLMFCSLFSDLVAETMTVRGLLSLTVIFRLFIWIVLVPAFYLLFNVYMGWKGFFIFAFMVIVLLDGFQESLANTSDLIYKGIDRLSHNYDMLITDEMHSRMSNIYQAVFDWSFAFLVVPLSVLAYFLKQMTDKSDLFILSSVMGIAFVLLSLISLCNYYFGMQVPIRMNMFLSNDVVELSVASVFEEIFNKLDDIKEGMFIACSQGYLMKSVFFLSMETAFEHSIVFFIIPIIAVTTPLFSEATMLTSNLSCVILISIGKLGGSIYYLYVTHMGRDAIGSVTRLHRTSNNIQKCLVMSCISLLLLPFSLYLDTTFPSLSPYRFVVISLGIFLFFAFSAYPKSTLALSMHATILSHPLSYKIFDFVGLFITFLDTLLVLGLSFFMNKLEGKYTIEAATFSIALFYVLHCLHQLGTGCNDITIDSSHMQSQALMWPPAY